MWLFFTLATTFLWGIAELFYKKGSHEEHKYDHLRVCVLVGAVMGIHAVFTLLTSDIAVGRRTGKNSINAYAEMSPKWKFLGIVTFLVPVLIMTYYAVIGGWIVRYVVAFLAGQGATGYLFESGQTVTCVKNGTAEFPALPEGILSAFALGGTARGITLEGLLYPLNDGELLPDVPLGVSNHFTGTPARVTVKNGTLTLVWDVPLLPVVKQKIF